MLPMPQLLMLHHKFNMLLLLKEALRNHSIIMFKERQRQERKVVAEGLWVAVVAVEEDRL
jgi:hypothetical protein